MAITTKSWFADFTNKYSLSKTLRFELKPIENTESMLRENSVFTIDGDRKKAYENIKPYFNKLHREFINEALVDARLEKLGEYFEILKKYKVDKKDKDLQKQVDSWRKKLREQVVAYFDKKGKEWATENYSHLKIKKQDLNILFEEEVFQILKDRYGNEKGTELMSQATGDNISIFDDWTRFTGYFTKFFDTRRNLYKDKVEKGKGKSGQISTRAIDQNLDRFLNNLVNYNSVKDKINVTEAERFFDLKADEVLSVDFYNKCLLQRGIDKYNDFLGGKTLDSGKKIRGVNEIINKYKQDNKGEKLPFLKKLDKQILSEKEKFIGEIETPEEFLELLRNFCISAETKIEIIKILLRYFFNDVNKYDLKGIYISKAALNTIFQTWTNETDNFNSNLYEILKNEKIVSSSVKKKDGGYSFPDFILLAYIKKSLEKIPPESRFWKERYYESQNGSIVLAGNESIWEQFLKIFEFEFFSHFKRTVLNKETGEQIQEGYDIFKSKFSNLLKDFKVDKNSKVIIKDFSDEVLYIYQMAKYFSLEKKRAWDTSYDDSLGQFYTDPNNGYLKFYENAYEEIVQSYNKIRNYLTKKPYKEKKWKLNFNCSYLLRGWSSTFDTYSSLIIEKGGNYYLAVINGKGLDKSAREQLLKNTSENLANKLVYDFQKPDNKNVPRLFIRSKGENFSPAVEELDLPIESIIDIYDKGYFKTENRENANFKESLIKIIEYFKLGFSKHHSYNHFTFKWRPSSEYKSIAEFYEDTIRSCYMLEWENINFDELVNLTSQNKLYLFQIYSKDFSKNTKGTPNLHSLYFRSLFSKENLEDNKGAIFKLSGGGEIFFRPKTSKENLGKKKDMVGKEVIEHKRYSEDKIFLHFPIELNYSRSIGKSFNTETNNLLANNPDINIIGVDRGEKHLAYYSIINQKGEMLLDEKGEPLSGSLNLVGKDSTNKPIDYHKKLEEKAAERKQARKDWQDIEGIKDLKKGYISQVVRKLADLAIKHNAIIVMEDLNMRFKQIRGGIEKSAYQQLEKALIEKLNFLVNKDETDQEKAGHLLKAYQLTAPFEAFKDMGKQTGIIFYTQASYTSRIDPLTGWRPNIYLKYSSAVKAKGNILNFSDIKFNAEKDRFEFTYDLKNFFNTRGFPNKTEWTVCSNVERFRWDRKLNNNKGGYTHYLNLTDWFKKLFDNHKIDYTGNILEQIDQLEVKGNENFFKDFIFYFNLICQIRNTQQDKDGDENDFILSPVEPFFDSRHSEIFGKLLPRNGDENGSYNIARKGSILLKKLTNHSKTDPDFKKYPDLFISNQEWDEAISDWDKFTSS